MKRYSMIFAAMMAASAAMAQDTYLNNTLTNQSDVMGTARYVGMGGAMGALGADISTISNNPAGIGLMRKSDISLTAGLNFPKGADSEIRALDTHNTLRGTMDQLGLVWSVKTDGTSKLKYLNMGINYQKRANYNSAFDVTQNLNGLSQMDQLAELATDGYDTDVNLAGAAVDREYLQKDDQGYYNSFSGETGRTTHFSCGSLQGYDVNLSANINNRAYLGVTIGIDQVKYKSETVYYEENTDPGDSKHGDYSHLTDTQIDGYGTNFKLGAIVRPFEYNPFRIGLAVETPTWYRMNSSVYCDLDAIDHTTPETYLEYNVRTPWKARVSMASTVGKRFAWDVEYEYANYGKTKMGYPKYGYYDDYQGSIFNFTRDQAMNDWTKLTVDGQHTFRAGIEVVPVDNFYLRMGYNYVTSLYKDGATFDQWSLDSHAMDYATRTSYMTTGAANILTAGMGFKVGKFYMDFAYKYRNQKGDFYAFDTSFTQDATSQFVQDNPAMLGRTITPASVDLSRHQLTATMGFHF